MKKEKHWLYCLLLFVLIGCRNEPTGIEIANGRFKSMYTQRVIKELTYMENNWLMIELTDQAYQKEPYHQEIKESLLDKHRISAYPQARYFMKVISLPAIEAEMAEFCKEHPNLLQIKIKEQTY